MKRTLKRLLCGFLVMLMCVTMLPVNAFAWSYMSHMNSANIIRMEMLSYDSPYHNLNLRFNVPGYGEFKYTIPEEFYAAIFNYPDAFRAGSLGPDFYPDLVIGQMYIHPYDYKARVGSGDWLELLIESVNRLPQGSQNRLRALSFTLGFMLHYCGDMFGHDFINTFSGGTFPSIMDVDITDTTDPELNNILSHMSMENYMDDLVNKEFYEDSKQIEIDAPDRFVADTLLLDSSIPSGAAKIFDQFGGAVIYIEKMLEFRNDVMDFADDLRDLTEPICMLLSSYADQWALDIDAAIYGLVDTFDRIAHRCVTGDPNPEIHEETIKDWILNGYPLSEMLGDMWDLPDVSDSAVGIIKEELSFWLEEYGWEALGIPSWLVDPPIPDWLKETFDWMFAGIKIPLALVKNLLCGLFAGILDAVVGGFVEFGVEAFDKYTARLEDPSVQLDHRDNPYRPSGTNNFEEFEEYMDRYAAEQELLEDYDLISLLTNSDGEDVLKQLTDSEFEAFYNTMMMFKLVLMGPENFTKFLNYFGIENQTAYQKNIGEIEATVLKLDVKTMDQQWAGTDDNVWVVVKDRRTGEEVKRKMLDNSFTNDLECGDLNTFYVELPEPMKLPDIDLYLEQHDTMTTDGGWDCESVTVTPMHAGYNVFLPIGLGGNPEMDAGVTWDLQFHTALIFRTNGLKVSANTPVTHVKVRIKTGDGSYASGTDQDVKISAFDRNETEPIPENRDYWVQLDLDKYLYDDFEDGDDDIYTVPLGDFDPASGKNKYPALGNLELIIKQYSDYDWYINNVTVTPYYGNWALTDPMDFGSHNVDHINYNVKLSPYQKIEDNSIAYKTYDGVSLTYETPLDDGLLKDMKSLDAGVQWENLHVLWNSPEGRSLFFKLFKGFSPEIIIDTPGGVISDDDYDITIDFTGKWNGISAERRNALSEYSQTYMKQGTYQTMPDVEGTAKVTFTNTATGDKDMISIPVEDNKAVLNSIDANLASLNSGVYDITVEYTPDSEDPQYGRAEATFRNALTVKVLGEYSVRVDTASTTADADIGLNDKITSKLNAYGTVTGSGVYKEGDRAYLTATPNTGYTFKYWLEDGEVILNGKPVTSTSIIVEEDRNLTAVFEPDTYTLKLTTNDDLGIAGTVTGGGTYDYGTKVEITATPNEGFVFAGWYDLERDILLSAKNTLTYTAKQNETLRADFANAATVNMPGGDDCGYSIYVDDANSEALDSLANSGKISREDLAALISDKAGTSFKVAKDSEVTFKVEIKDGYEKTDDFKVKAGRTTLLAQNGKYTFTASVAETQVSITGVRKIETTPTPVIDYMEFDDGSITFQAYVPDEEGEVTLWLYVNNNQIEAVDEIVEYTLSKKNLDRNDGVFSVSAVAQAEGKLISETATLTGSSSDVIVPVEIEDTENGTVEMEAGAKYDAPGTQTKLTVTPDEGYVLHKLIVTYDVDGEEVEVEVTDEGIVESEAEEVIIGTEKVEIDGEEYEYFTRTSDDVEIVKEDGVYYFTRPAGKATVKALFKPENAVLGDVNGDEEVTMADALYLLRYSILPERYPLSDEHADYNNDGFINAEDAAYLSHHIQNPEAYPFMNE